MEEVPCLLRDVDLEGLGEETEEGEALCQRSASEETPPSCQNSLYSKNFFFSKMEASLLLVLIIKIIILIKIPNIQKNGQMTVKCEICPLFHIPEIIPPLLSLSLTPAVFVMKTGLCLLLCTLDAFSVLFI